MKYDIGLCLWTLGDINLQEKLQIASDLGVDGVELEGDLSSSPRLIKELLNKYELKALSITPENRDIVSSDDIERGKNINYYLQLIDWAVEVGAPRLTLHGEVGLIRSEDYVKDYELLIKATRTIVNYAKSKKIDIVFEVLNRYESYQIRTGSEAIRLVQEIGEPNLKILLDSYHMNIEESNPSKAILEVGKHLGVYHIADSNRLGIGSGSINFPDQLKAIEEISFAGPIVIELTASGPDPFTAVKNGNYIDELIKEYKQSIQYLRKE